MLNLATLKYTTIIKAFLLLAGPLPPTLTWFYSTLINIFTIIQPNHMHRERINTREASVGFLLLFLFVVFLRKFLHKNIHDIPLSCLSFQPSPSTIALHLHHYLCPFPSVFPASLLISCGCVFPPDGTLSSVLRFLVYLLVGYTYFPSWSLSVSAANIVL